MKNFIWSISFALIIISVPTAIATFSVTADTTLQFTVGNCTLMSGSEGTGGSDQFAVSGNTLTISLTSGSFSVQCETIALAGAAENCLNGVRNYTLSSGTYTASSATACVPGGRTRTRITDTTINSTPAQTQPIAQIPTTTAAPTTQTPLPEEEQAPEEESETLAEADIMEDQTLEGLSIEQEEDPIISLETLRIADFVKRIEDFTTETLTLLTRKLEQELEQLTDTLATEYQKGVQSIVKESSSFRERVSKVRKLRLNTKTEERRMKENYKRARKEIEKKQL